MFALQFLFLPSEKIQQMFIDLEDFYILTFIVRDETLRITFNQLIWMD